MENISRKSLMQLNYKTHIAKTKTRVFHINRKFMTMFFTRNSCQLYICIYIHIYAYGAIYFTKRFMKMQFPNHKGRKMAYLKYF